MQQSTKNTASVPNTPAPNGVSVVPALTTSAPNGLQNAIDSASSVVLGAPALADALALLARLALAPSVFDGVVEIDDPPALRAAFVTVATQLPALREELSRALQPLPLNADGTFQSAQEAADAQTRKRKIRLLSMRPACLSLCEMLCRISCISPVSGR